MAAFSELRPEAGGVCEHLVTLVACLGSVPAECLGYLLVIHGRPLSYSDFIVFSFFILVCIDRLIS